MQWHYIYKPENWFTNFAFCISNIQLQNLVIYQIIYNKEFRQNLTIKKKILVDQSDIKQYDLFTDRMFVEVREQEN